VVAAAGALSASYVGFLEPGAASFDESLLMLSVVIIGGSGNVRGPVAGALVVTILPEAIRLVGFPDALAANIRLGIYGLALILLMHLRPQGLLGRYRVA
jgi:branched-chain amino acid transport system permease protein